MLVISAYMVEPICREMEHVPFDRMDCLQTFENKQSKQLVQTSVYNI